MIPLSVCIITLNEEAEIEDCLASVRGIGEIVVIDSHSTDRTVEICEAHGARVIARAFPGHVEQKNYAVDQARTDWVLCLDADERVSPEMRADIERVLALASVPCDGYEFPRRNRYLGDWFLRGGWYPDAKVRLFRRDRGRWGGENPHDHVHVAGRVGRLSGPILHHAHDDLSDHLRTIDSFSSIAAREKARRGVRFAAVSLVLRPPLRFFKTYVLQGACLEGTRGFIMAAMGAISVFMKYAKLWERGRRR